MTVLTEGNLQISIPDGIPARRFDDSGHGLTHCMKAVDFIVERQDRLLFIEFKDPEHPESRPESKLKFMEMFLAGRIDEDLKHKYRDSFLYQWACEGCKKPIYFLVLVALESLTEADLIARTDDLKRKIPMHGPPSGVWRRPIVAGCGVFNISTWNRTWSSYPVCRISP